MDISVRNVGRYKEVTYREGNATVESGILTEYDCEVEATKLREAADELYVPPEISQERELRRAVLEFLLTYVPAEDGAELADVLEERDLLKEFVEKVRGIVE